MTLRQRQSLFAKMLISLMSYALAQGYEITLGEAYRSPEEAARLAKLGKGIKRSLHCDKLAIDLNLFKDGKYLSANSAHEFLGVYWESLHPDCCWGGRFGDGNHYSVTYQGRK